MQTISRYVRRRRWRWSATSLSAHTHARAGMECRFRQWFLTRAPTSPTVPHKWSYHASRDSGGVACGNGQPRPLARPGRATTFAHNCSSLCNAHAERISTCRSAYTSTGPGILTHPPIHTRQHPSISPIARHVRNSANDCAPSLLDNFSLIFCAPAAGRARTASVLPSSSVLCPPLRQPPFTRQRVYQSFSTPSLHYRNSLQHRARCNVGNELFFLLAAYSSVLTIIMSELDAGTRSYVCAKILQIANFENEFTNVTNITELELREKYREITDELFALLSRYNLSEEFAENCVSDEFRRLSKLGLGNGGSGEKDLFLIVFLLTEKTRILLFSAQKTLIFVSRTHEFKKKAHCLPRLTQMPIKTNSKKSCPHFSSRKATTFDGHFRGFVKKT